MRRDEGDEERLKALVEDRGRAPLGTDASNATPEGVSAETPLSWFRTSDLSRVKREECRAEKPPEQARLF